jgi:hypothetical protein
MIRKKKPMRIQNSATTEIRSREETVKGAVPFFRMFQSAISVRTFLAGAILLCAASLSAAAQNGGNPVGGNWMEYESEDKMTLARKVKFVLTADNFLRDSSYQKPKIEVFCVNGKFERSLFYPNVRLGPPNRPGFWGQPQAMVLVRVDDTHDTHGWNWVPGSALSMDKGTTRKLFRANVFKVEFRAARSRDIAEFSPGGIYTDRVSQACGFNPK